MNLMEQALAASSQAVSTKKEDEPAQVVDEA